MCLVDLLQEQQFQRSISLTLRRCGVFKVDAQNCPKLLNLKK